MKTDDLILYRDFGEKPYIREVCALFKEAEKKDVYSVAAGLVELSNRLGFEGNLWQDYLTWILVNNENSFSKACEMRKSVQGSLYELAMHDMEIFRWLFLKDLTKIDEKYGTDCFAIIKAYTPCDDNGIMFNKRIRDSICSLSKKMAGCEDTASMLKALMDFYACYGVGKFGLNKAFRIRETENHDFEIEPIRRIAHVSLSDLVGYEEAKKKLTDNTEAFVEGRKANNCLLFGDAGTGKSSCIKGIMNEYYDRGLRIIEIYKHQFRFLNEIVSRIKDRNYRFIIYMDDLSFEDSEIEYKYLKAVIEGGLERKPDNILIYATSNRRHLVHENFGDKLDRRENDDIHESDTVQEKLSLYNRFGVTIYFGRPSPKEFKNIVTVLAKRNGLKTDEETLLAEANKWELSHGGLSGRTAQQFIDYFLGTVEK